MSFQMITKNKTIVANKAQSESHKVCFICVENYRQFGNEAISVIVFVIFIGKLDIGCKSVFKEFFKKKYSVFTIVLQ